MPERSSVPTRKPLWLRKSLSLGATASIKKVLREKQLHTVCESARCPNMGECFSSGTATLMILGETCNRTCAFCAVKSGIPSVADAREPENVATMVKELCLSYAVITSVTRDDLPDGGAGHFADTVRAIRKKTPKTTIELLVPDFGGSSEALETVLLAKPDVLNHNIETVPSLYPQVRPQASFDRSCRLLRASAGCNITVKSGIMVGFGETEKELVETMKKLNDCGVEILTIGQYLAPSKRHFPVREYFSEEWFENIAGKGKDIGIPKVFAGPFVRSSYMAKEVALL